LWNDPYFHFANYFANYFLNIPFFIISMHHKLILQFKVSALLAPDTNTIKTAVRFVFDFK